MANSRCFLPSAPLLPTLYGGPPANMPPRRLLTGTALGLVMACANSAPPAAAQSVVPAPMQLPAVSVEGSQPGAADYKTDLPSLPKLTAPLLDTPQSITDI